MRLRTAVGTGLARSELMPSTLFGIYDERRKKDKRRGREGRMDKDGSRKWWLEMKAARTSTMRTMVKGKGWKPTRPYLLLFLQLIHIMHCYVNVIINNVVINHT